MWPSTLNTARSSAAAFSWFTRHARSIFCPACRSLSASTLPAVSAMWRPYSGSALHRTLCVITGVRLLPAEWGPVPTLLRPARVTYGEREHSSHASSSSSSSLTVSNYFQTENKNRESFLEAVDVFIESSVHRRGVIEFILTALTFMREYGVHRDIVVYKKLIELFPIGPLKTDSYANLMFPIHPRHQDCAVSILKQMERNKLMPDLELRNILVARFGKMSLPCRRLARMFYWMSKFQHQSPWPLPVFLPVDQLKLAQLGASQIASCDPRGHVTTYLENDLPADAVDRTWIVSCQSDEQRQLLRRHDVSQSLLLEGAFKIWLRDQCLNYFVLRAEPAECDVVSHEGFDQDRLVLLENWLWQDRLMKRRNRDSEQEQNKPVPYLGQTFSDYQPGWFLKDTRPPSVYRQDDGTILGICITGTSSADSLLSWLQLLQLDCPRMEQMAVMFPSRSPLGEVVPVHKPEQFSPPKLISESMD